MDTSDITGEKEPQPRKKTLAMVWNILTIMILLAILCVVGVFFLIYINPNSNINPFPPPTLYPSMVPATITVTPRITLVPSWTPTNAMTQVTGTSGSKKTPSITRTLIMGPSNTPPTITVTPGGFAFVLEPGSPSAIAWTIFHPDADCNWTGVSGQVISLNEEAVTGLLVQLGGSLPGTESVDMSTMTGYAPQYGPGGFEFTIANKLVASSDTLWIQVMDQQKLPLSDRVYFSTFADCEKNLTVISFVQTR